MPKDKHTIINEMVDNAAEIMRAKMEYNELIVEQLVKKHGEDNRTVEKLRELIRRTKEAVQLIEEYSGCWA